MVVVCGDVLRDGGLAWDEQAWGELGAEGSGGKVCKQQTNASSNKVQHQSETDLM